MEKSRSFTKELIWIYAVGLAGMLIPYTRYYFMLITPVNLLVVTGLLFYNHRRWDVRTVLSFTLVGILSFFIEALGVNTGLIFGEYSYGRTLGPALLNTPLMIGLNWVLLVYLCHSVSVTIFEKLPSGSVAGRLYSKAPSLLVAFAGGLLMVVYDIILEPSAIQLDMWSWMGVGIPIQNYVAWFLFSFVFILFIGLSRIDTRNRTALPLYLLQLAFFLILDIWFIMV
ncbi:MAG: carotenoid biosynthesis protein [Bacteroidales bacterium]